MPPFQWHLPMKGLTLPATNLGATYLGATNAWVESYPGEISKWSNFSKRLRKVLLPTRKKSCTSSEPLYLITHHEGSLSLQERYIRLPRDENDPGSVFELIENVNLEARWKHKCLSCTSKNYRCPTSRDRKINYSCVKCDKVTCDEHRISCSLKYFPA